MADEPSTAILEILEEIRDLLTPLSAQARAWIASDGPEAIRDIVGSGQRQAAARLMDGRRTRSEIMAATGIADGNLSTLVRDLREAGFVTERASKPKLVITPSTVWPNASTAGRKGKT